MENQTRRQTMPHQECSATQQDSSITAQHQCTIRQDNFHNNVALGLQCFDSVGWAAGRASGL